MTPEQHQQLFNEVSQLLVKYQCPIAVLAYLYPVKGDLETWRTWTHVYYPSCQFGRVEVQAKECSETVLQALDTFVVDTGMVQFIEPGGLN